MEDIYEAFDMRTGEVYFTGTEDEVNAYIERCEAEDELYNPDGLDDCIEYGTRRVKEEEFEDIDDDLRSNAPCDTYGMCAGTRCPHYYTVCHKPGIY